MKNYILLAAAALTLGACSNDDENLNNGPIEARITAGVSTPDTRAINNKWEADEIGVMVTSAPTSNMEDLYKNVKYTTTASDASAANFTAEAGKGIFFQDANETVTFAAYGPYQPSEANALPGTDGVISDITTEHQSTRETQKAFDYIYASGATASRSTPTVQFSNGNAFSHKMARLIIIVQTSREDGFKAEEVTGGTYSLSGLNHEGTFNVTTGVAAATANPETKAADWSLTDNSLKTEEETQVTFTSILYPQTLSGALTFKAVIGGQTYVNNQDIKPALEAGYSYTYTITTKKTGLELSGCTIEDWIILADGSGTQTGDATMQ